MAMKRKARRSSDKPLSKEAWLMLKASLGRAPTLAEARAFAKPNISGGLAGILRRAERSRRGR